MLTEMECRSAFAARTDLGPGLDIGFIYIATHKGDSYAVEWVVRKLSPEGERA